MQTFCGLTTDGMLDYLAAIYRLTPVPLDPAHPISARAADTATPVDPASEAQPGFTDMPEQTNPDTMLNGGGKVTTGALAEELCVSPAAVSSMLRRLQDSGFVERSNTDGITLARQGYLAALQLIRCHRLLEVFLIEIMDFTWDQVDLEAHRLEHAISAEFEERIDRLCGRPTHCPHGDPIPDKNGTVAHEYFPSVVEITPGQRVRLRRVGNKDARILRYLSQLRLVPGQIITLTDLAPFNGPVTLEVIGERGLVDEAGKYQPSNYPHSDSATVNGDIKDNPISTTQVLGRELAEQLFVEPLPVGPRENEVRTESQWVNGRQTEPASLEVT